MSPGPPTRAHRFGTDGAVIRSMSDSRGSPIPQDRVRENINVEERAREAKEEERQRERWLKDRGVDDRPGGDDAKERPGEGGH